MSECMDRPYVGTKKSGRCREVAVVERWPLVEVQLYRRNDSTPIRLLTSYYGTRISKLLHCRPVGPNAILAL